MEKSLKILIANSSRKWIGEAAHTLFLCQQLLARGHKVWLCCRRGWELEKRALSITELNVIPLNMWSRAHLLYDLKDISQLRRLIKENKIDIVHVHRGKDHWLAALALQSMRKPPPLVRTRHVVVPLRQHIFNKWLFKNCTDAVISVSQRAKESLGELLEFSPLERQPVIYSAVDTESFSPSRRNAELRRRLGVNDDGLLVGLIARFQRIKGQRQFLKAVKLVLEKNTNPQKLRFLLAGKYASTRGRKYQRLAQNLGINENLIIPDEIEDIAQLVASLDIGVVASLGSEGSSRIILEYMASGVPVVATAVGGIPELIKNQQSGLLVEPGNVQDLANAIKQLIDSPTLRQKFAQQGLKETRDFLNPVRFISEIEHLYSQLLE